MMATEKSPYWVKIRGTDRTKDPWDKGFQLKGFERKRGVEALLASWDGAVNVRVYLHRNGQTWLKIQLMKWPANKPDANGTFKVVFNGPIDGSDPIVLQESLFAGEDE